MNRFVRATGTAAATLLVLASTGCLGDNKTDTVQLGYRGVAIEYNYTRGELQKQFAQVKIPDPLPPAGESPPGPLPWQNVQVLNDISVAEFNRTMIAMSTWVAGTGNCAYCHNIANLASDTLANGKPIYTKLVARRMLQMTRQINGQYSAHVKNTGVTCYTCHLGKPLPNGLWFYSSQNDYLRHYLDRDGARVISQTVAPSNGEPQLGQAGGVDARAHDQPVALARRQLHATATTRGSSPAGRRHRRSVSRRCTASSCCVTSTPTTWPRCSRVFPAVRLGAMGDAPKAQCATCHNGVYKPLYAAQMAKHYPALWGRADWNGVPFPGIAPKADSVPAAPAVPPSRAAGVTSSGAGLR